MWPFKKSDQGPYRTPAGTPNKPVQPTAAYRYEGNCWVWFDAAQAKHWEYRNEMMYLTAKGTWILGQIHHPKGCVVQSKEEAFTWFLRNLPNEDVVEHFPGMFPEETEV